ncbi:DUF3604 domain-containing protein [Gammaproteobacteria bacterium]|nr:DUF3604 domain-containing protein [Gammaproteobacteria bacterium]MDC0089860.1 DUF3604 domain-containing protein [Gammaproteobacteria bacterium]MDC1387640.1 DUF3604 domain-containing protein [Gammaproteobacteria bacterium]
MRNNFIYFLIFLIPFSLLASDIQYYPNEDRRPCDIYVKEKIPLFGDLHVHTALSLDANTQGTLNTPDDAYRYAKGQSLYLQPYSSDGTSSRSSRLNKPLDFAAVTDHAELLGEVRMCLDDKSSKYSSLQCKAYRNFPKLSYFYMNAKASMRKPLGFCGESREFCLDAAQAPWQETIQAAEKHYDRTSNCKFTSFVGYEWTGAVYSGNNLHRNIIFNNSNVPMEPVSFYEAPTRKELWNLLDKTCSENCDYVVIPHNSNLSNGYMFEEPDQDEILIQSTKEPLVEIFQHKGSSECNVDPNDPLCNFEQLPYKDFRSKFQNDLSSSPDSSFVREALGKGLLSQDRQSINPLKFGIIASTDTHLGTPGAVDESVFLGHGGAGKSFRSSIPEGLPDDIEFNPGGLAVAWAEENSRSAIFDAFQRKEVYGTSGPRFIVRFFVGDNLDKDLCNNPDNISYAYANATPMGGTIPSESLSQPSIFISASADSAIKDQFIEKLQVVKGVVRNGELLTTIHDVGVTDTQSKLDISSCEVSGAGEKAMCSVWNDPNFNSSENAYYYVRVVANKSCRWSHNLCLQNPEYCEADLDASIPKVIQERAWTSPVWLETS